MRADERVRIPLDSNRVGRVTLYGAIGDGLIHPVFYFGRSTNTEDFLEFLQQVSLARRILVGNRKPFLIYDNHSAHRGPEVVSLIERDFNKLL
jgi:hypothetical protein